MNASLSVVIPVFNEPDWIEQALIHLERAIIRSGFHDAEILVVDDGSEPPIDQTRLAQNREVEVRVLRQQNGGRFAARLHGVQEARHEIVLLIDSRVLIAEDSLAFVARARERAGRNLVWNGHVDVAVAGNPYARFWNILTEVAFREYFANPRQTSFGLDDFDRFPKGTTCFLAPRELLLAACASFDSRFEDLRDANDDTILIRWIATREPINIAPSFRCTYHSRTALRPFLRHAYHRGGVFLDGYLEPGGRFFPALVLFFPASLLTLGFVLTRPKQAAVAAAGSVSAGAVGVSVARRSARDGMTVGLLGPLFAVAYGAGIWRGLVLAQRARWRSHPAS